MDTNDPSPLVVRVALFPSDRQGDYRKMIEERLFPTLRSVPGYVGTFLGREPETGRLVSLSFWTSASAASAAEDAFRRELSALPAGTAPRPASVEKFVVEYRDVRGSFR